jgi:N-acetylglucosamine transport system permease protein
MQPILDPSARPVTLGRYASAQAVHSPVALIRGIFIHAVLLFWMAIVVFPFIWLIYTSFKTDRQIFFNPWLLPSTWRVDNYVRAWVGAHVGTFFINSIIVVGFSLVLTILFSAMAAYVLARYEFPGRQVVTYTFMAGMTFPVFLALVPLFFLVRSLGLISSLPGLIIVYVAYSLPFSIFFLFGFFRTLPTELSEAAIIDGASQQQVFWRIMLPLAQPGLITVAIFNFLGQWNQYILPLVLIQDSAKYVLTQGLAYMAIQQYYTNDWSGLFAALVIVMIPTLLVYTIFQGRLTRGITVGALKG